ncbi:NIF domain-containing protein [Cephalotus follicularis]|uniref:NIF domain-containing protein n=1 Tax=Cephalotus follicularis TaxID=3775 RepID=A0A1Q3CH89_CEPFO|nr:NIF domain-containing protein [Cephalotus follicularis]
MPSLKMKTKLGTGSLREINGLCVCQKSSVISKRSSSRIKILHQTAEADINTLNCHDVPLSAEVSTVDLRSDKAIDQQALLEEENFQFQHQSSNLVDSPTMGRMESTLTCSSNLETIFSPVLEPIETPGEPDISIDAGSKFGLEVPELGAVDIDDNRSSCDYQTCNISDFFISDMMIQGLPFDENLVDGEISETNMCTDYKCADPSMLYDIAEEYMILPFLEDTSKTSNTNNVDSHEEAITDSDNTSLYLAINQLKSCNQESDIISDSYQAEDFDPQFFIKNLPELSDMVTTLRPNVLRKESWRRKPVTLVLDLDETLVHSTLEQCDDANFTFTVFFNMKEHTVYVKQRPYLHTFLERVAEMFEVIIFTASQSIYAEQLLDMLDPDGKLISRRVYRESCIFSDGSYTKDLTVLGIDLAKVAIIDNSPQVFRLQLNNGIPIKSWFDDPTDCALISLLPFLETLVDADDVRPIIAKRFGRVMNTTRLPASGKIIGMCNLIATFI